MALDSMDRGAATANDHLSIAELEGQAANASPLTS